MAYRYIYNIYSQIQDNKNNHKIAVNKKKGVIDAGFWIPARL